MSLSDAVRLANMQTAHLILCGVGLKDGDGPALEDFAFTEVGSLQVLTDDVGDSFAPVRIPVSLPGFTGHVYGHVTPCGEFAYLLEVEMPDGQFRRVGFQLDQVLCLRGAITEALGHDVYANEEGFDGEN